MIGLLIGSLLTSRYERYAKPLTEFWTRSVFLTSVTSQVSEAGGLDLRLHVQRFVMFGLARRDRPSPSDVSSTDFVFREGREAPEAHCHRSSLA